MINHFAWAIGAVTGSARHAGPSPRYPFSPGLISVVLLPLLAACGESTGAAVVHPPKPVLVAPIKFADGQDVRTFTAQIKPRIEGSHGFRVAGRVVRRFVDVGSTVKAGDPLAVLDDADFAFSSTRPRRRSAPPATSFPMKRPSRRASPPCAQGFTAAAALIGKATADEARPPDAGRAGGRSCPQCAALCHPHCPG